MKKQVLLVLSLVCLASCGGKIEIKSSDPAAGTSSQTPAPSSEGTSEAPVSEAGSSEQEASEPGISEPGTSEPETSESTPVESEKTISLYRNSRFAISSPAIDASKPLATYHHIDYGDAPYVEFDEYFAAVGSGGLISKGATERLDDHLFAYSQGGVIIALFNTATDILTIKNFDYLGAFGNTHNNGVGWDTCDAGNAAPSSVLESKRTQILGERKDEVYDFGKYNFDLVEQDGKLYFPIYPVNSILFRSTTATVVFNGCDYYSTLLLSEDVAKIAPSSYNSFYASNDAFVYNGTLYEKVDPLGEEAYRFAGENEDHTYATLEFAKDGSISPFLTPSLDKQGEPATLPHALAYEATEDGIFVVASVPAIPDMTSSFKIPPIKTYFNAKTRSESTAKHAYDVLRFHYENIYGLRDDLYKREDVKDFNELIEKKGLKSGLLNLVASVYDEALCKFLMGTVDDGHTKYTGTSMYTGIPSKGAKELVDKHMGPRRSGLFDKLAEYQTLRTNAMKAIDPIYEDASKQVGLFLEGNTAVIRFDAFLATGSIADFLGDRKPVSEDITTALNSATADGFYLSFEEIKKHDEIENVVIDLTCNGGGAALTLPYLATIWTKDPRISFYDTTSKIIKEFHYNVDFNRNGVFGEEGDTYEGKYDFFVLTSDFSFSCGNALPTMAYADGVKVIGKQSGGGASPVATVYDGSGTIFNTSMPVQIVYPVGENAYRNNDAGIPIEEGYALEKDSWYNLPALSAFVNTL